MVQFGCGYFNALRDPNMSGPTPVVIAGPSGVGKGTIIAKLQARFPNQFGFCVSHTTRQPRPGEENGTHYHFVEKSEMERGIEVAACVFPVHPYYCTLLMHLPPFPLRSVALLSLMFTHVTTALP
jgi:hypothetical protein